MKRVCLLRALLYREFLYFYSLLDSFGEEDSNEREKKKVFTRKRERDHTSSIIPLVGEKNTKETQCNF